MRYDLYFDRLMGVGTDVRMAGVQSHSGDRREESHPTLKKVPLKSDNGPSSLECLVL